MGHSQIHEISSSVCQVTMTAADYASRIHNFSHQPEAQRILAYPHLYLDMDRPEIFKMTSKFKKLFQRCGSLIIPISTSSLQHVCL